MVKVKEMAFVFLGGSWGTSTACVADQGAVRPASSMQPSICPHETCRDRTIALTIDPSTLLKQHISVSNHNRLRPVPVAKEIHM